MATPLQTYAVGFPRVLPSPRWMLVLRGPGDGPSVGPLTPVSPPLPCGFPVVIEGPDGFTQQPHGGQRLLSTPVHEALPREGSGGVWGKNLVEVQWG